MFRSCLKVYPNKMFQSSTESSSSLVLLNVLKPYDLQKVTQTNREKVQKDVKTKKSN